MEDHIRMCRFTHNGQPETGEYTEQEDRTGGLVRDDELGVTNVVADLIDVVDGRAIIEVAVVHPTKL